MQPRDWLTVCSIVLSIVALWRTGRIRVLDLRTKTRKDLAELRQTLDHLLQSLPIRIQSRERAMAAIG